jgi:type II secretory pathway pseudopilin PulG
MPKNLLASATAILGLVFASGIAQGQTITVVSGYNAGQPGTTPPSSKPSGTWSVKPTNNNWQIIVDWGTINNGQFTQWVGPNEIKLPVIPQANGGPWNWQTLVALVQPPRNLYVRARLQEDVAIFGWQDRATAYATCP